jgi:hypothetical protein
MVVPVEPFGKNFTAVAWLQTIRIGLELFLFALYIKVHIQPFNKETTPLIE